MSAESVSETHSDSPRKQPHLKRGVIRIIIFSFFSSGIYFIYWYYVTSKLVCRELHLDYDATLRTLGLFIPFLNLYLLYRLLKDIEMLVEKEDIRTSYTAGFALFLNIFTATGFLWAQNLLNRYFDKKTDKQALSAKYTLGEASTVIVPFVLFIAFAILGAVFSSKPFSYRNVNFASPSPVESPGDLTFITLGYYECTVSYEKCYTTIPIRGSTTPGSTIEILEPVEEMLSVDSQGNARGDIPMVLYLGTNSLKFRIVYPSGKTEIRYVDATLETKD